MKILITGHKGFIGSYLWNHIEKAGVTGVELDGIDFPDDIGDFKTDKTVSYTHLTLPTKRIV